MDFEEKQYLNTQFKQLMEKIWELERQQREFAKDLAEWRKEKSTLLPK